MSANNLCVCSTSAKCAIHHYQAHSRFDVAMILVDNMRGTESRLQVCKECCDKLVEAGTARRREMLPFSKLERDLGFWRI